MKPWITLALLLASTRLGAQGNGRDTVFFPAADRIAIRMMRDVPSGRSERASSPSSERGVRATDSTRLAAMTHADLSALDTLLGADLTYTHNDGSRQSKAEFLADLRSRQLVYLGLRSDSVNVRLYGTTALLDGRIWLRARSGTQQGSFTARFLEAYENRRGHWELVAWQSTRLTPIVVEK